MPVYDQECPQCGVFEAIAGYEESLLPCPMCGKQSRRIISGSHRNNDDAPWIRTVLEVVDKHGKEPETKEFLRNPTRSNMKAWMKARGLRHMEPGEEKTVRYDDTQDRKRRAQYMMEQHRKRTALEVRS